jgi:cytosine/adenosine deaminase-related metal-dependent hydrolase
MADEDDSVKKYGQRVIERFKEAGVLEFNKTILGHCLHLDKKEKQIVENSPAWVVQNTESNLNNNVGFFNSIGLGNNIFTGTDGMHSDMIRSIQSAYFTGQHFDSITPVSAWNRLRDVHQYLQTNGFQGDSENNLVVLDYNPPTPVSSGNFLGHFFYGLQSKDILHVISGGKLIVKDKNVITVNENEVLDFSKEMAVKLWEKLRI